MLIMDHLNTLIFPSFHFRSLNLHSWAIIAPYRGIVIMQEPWKQAMKLWTHESNHPILSIWQTKGDPSAHSLLHLQSSSFAADLCSNNENTSYYLWHMLDGIFAVHNTCSLNLIVIGLWIFSVCNKCSQQFHLTDTTILHDIRSLLYGILQCVQEGLVCCFSKLLHIGVGNIC